MFRPRSPPSPVLTLGRALAAAPIWRGVNLLPRLDGPHPQPDLRNTLSLAPFSRFPVQLPRVGAVWTSDPVLRSQRGLGTHLAPVSPVVAFAPFRAGAPSWRGLRPRTLSYAPVIQAQSQERPVLFSCSPVQLPRAGVVRPRQPAAAAAPARVAPGAAAGAAGPAGGATACAVQRQPSHVPVYTY